MSAKALNPIPVFLDSIPLTTKDCGVYAIINRVNHRLYVGSSRNLSGRRSLHKHHISLGKHSTQELQQDILANPEAFEFAIIELCSESELIDREQFWMDFYQSYLPINGYNKCRYAKSILGYRHSDDMKRDKFASSMKGKKRPPRSKEWSAKISNALTGRRFPKRHKPIVQMSSSGEIVNRWSSATDAARSLGVSSSALLVRALKTNCNAYGYKWSYALT